MHPPDAAAVLSNARDICNRSLSYINRSHRAHSELFCQRQSLLRAQYGEQYGGDESWDVMLAKMEEEEERSRTASSSTVDDIKSITELPSLDLTAALANQDTHAPNHIASKTPTSPAAATRSNSSSIPNIPRSSSYGGHIALADASPSGATQRADNPESPGNGTNRTSRSRSIGFRNSMTRRQPQCEDVPLSSPLEADAGRNSLPSISTSNVTLSNGGIHSTSATTQGGIYSDHNSKDSLFLRTKSMPRDFRLDPRFHRRAGARAAADGIPSTTHLEERNAPTDATPSGQEPPTVNGWSTAKSPQSPQALIPSRAHQHQKHLYGKSIDGSETANGPGNPMSISDGGAIGTPVRGRRRSLLALASNRFDHQQRNYTATGDSINLIGGGGGGSISVLDRSNDVADSFSGDWHLPSSGPHLALYSSQPGGSVTSPGSRPVVSRQESGASVTSPGSRPVVSRQESGGSSNTHTPLSYTNYMRNAPAGLTLHISQVSSPTSPSSPRAFNVAHSPDSTRSASRSTSPSALDSYSRHVQYSSSASASPRNPFSPQHVFEKVADTTLLRPPWRASKYASERSTSRRQRPGLEVWEVRSRPALKLAATFKSHMALYTTGDSGNNREVQNVMPSSDKGTTGVCDNACSCQSVSAATSVHGGRGSSMGEGSGGGGRGREHGTQGSLDSLRRPLNSGMSSMTSRTSGRAAPGASQGAAGSLATHGSTRSYGSQRTNHRSGPSKRSAQISKSHLADGQSRPGTHDADVGCMSMQTTAIMSLKSSSAFPSVRASRDFSNIGYSVGGDRGLGSCQQSVAMVAEASGSVKGGKSGDTRERSGLMGRFFKALNDFGRSETG